MAGTKLCCKTDSLRLASGKSSGSPSKRKIFQANFCQKSYSGTDFFQNLLPDQLLLAGKFQVMEKALQFLHWHIGHFIDILICHSHCQRFLFQSLALAGITWSDTHKALIFLLHSLRTGLPVSLLHVPDQSRKRHIIDTFPALALIINFHRMATGTIDENILNFLRVFTERCIQGKIIFSGKSIQNRPRKTSLCCTGLPSENCNCSLIDAQLLIRNHQVNIKFHLITKSQTLRAGTEGIIERKAPRFDLINADSAVRAGKTLAEVQKFPVHGIYYEKAVCQFQYCLNGIGKTFLNSWFHNETVHNNLNIMLNVLIQLDLF